jgi:hypothetical protein
MKIQSSASHRPQSVCNDVILWKFQTTKGLTSEDEYRLPNPLLPFQLPIPTQFRIMNEFRHFHLGNLGIPRFEDNVTAVRLHVAVDRGLQVRM